MSFPIRSPRALTGGIVVFARVLDKIWLHAEGKLPDGYHVGLVPGNRTFKCSCATLFLPGKWIS